MINKMEGGWALKTKEVPCEPWAAFTQTIVCERKSGLI